MATDWGVLFSARHSSRLLLSGEFQKSVEDYLRYHYIQGSTPDTIATYKKMLRWFGEYLDTEKPVPAIGEISASHIVGHLELLKLRGVAPRSLKGRFGAIYTFFEWAVGWELIKSNPAKLIKRPRAPKKPKRFITRDEFDAILEICPQGYFLGARRQAMFRVLISSGVRQNELAHLDLSDLDWKRSRIHVRFGKGQKERVVPFPKSTQRAMLRYIHYRTDDVPNLWVREGGPRSGSGRRAMTYEGIEQDIRRMMHYAGVDIKDKAHAFRRTLAANMLSGKVEREHVQALGGWETAAMLELYVGWRKTEQDEALDAVKDVDPWA